MAINYAYNYAQIDLETGECRAVRTISAPIDPLPAPLVEIPVYDEDYVGKYYNQADGNWYEDAAFTIPWESSLL